MGMTYTSFGAPVTTKNLQANADLDLGSYDLIATDVKCDTAEADEFVGGVGNFTSGLFSGGVDVSGILHAENALQVDGNLTLEGAINNVNIDDDGNISAGTYNGVSIKKVITVTPNNTYSPNYSHTSYVSVNRLPVLLPPIYGHVYTGTFRFYNRNTSSSTIAYRRFNNDWENQTLNINASSYADITLSNADMLMVIQNSSSSTSVSPCCYTLS